MYLLSGKRISTSLCLCKVLWQCLLSFSHFILLCVWQFHSFFIKHFLIVLGVIELIQHFQRLHFIALFPYSLSWGKCNTFFPLLIFHFFTEDAARLASAKFKVMTLFNTNKESFDGNILMKLNLSSKMKCLPRKIKFT